MATAQGESEQPPSRLLYRACGEKPSANASSRAITQNSELASSRSSDSRRSVNGSVTGEIRAHCGNLPSVQTRAKARASASGETVSSKAAGELRRQIRPRRPLALAIPVVTIGQAPLGSGAMSEGLGLLQWSGC